MIKIFRIKNVIPVVFITFCYFLFPKMGYSQSVIAAGGEYYSNAESSISFTIGETVIDAFVESNCILTQGFQQSNLVVTKIDETLGLGYEVKVFPNPTENILYLHIGKQVIFGMKYLLLDMNGNLLQQIDILSKETEIKFTDYPPANYLLRIFDNATEIKSFQIVKVK